MKLTSLATAALLASTSFAKNILLTNDDSWAATNIRALYYELKNAGHTVLLSAPAVQMSGQGGRFVIPSTNVLQQDSIFSYKKAGDPAWGYEESDINIWYFNGTPAACVAFAFDYILPNYFNNMSIDLVVGGPNEGTNMGARDYVLSGTIGSAHYAAERGYPSIAFSGSNSNNSFFEDNLNGDVTTAPYIYAKAATKLINALFDAQGDNERVLPFATGLNVNFPVAGSDLGSSCLDVGSFQSTRFSGNSLIYKIAYDSTTGLVSQTTTSGVGTTDCVNGDCTLASEFTVIGAENCISTISVFSVDPDAPLALHEEAQNLFSSVLV
ncbi:unnamed protein product [Kuraishia capsulata CBS 1993]|uniref:Survival protein SurE-like phosphatase/nucleotidase domain-containing protein n=1 Tax=Kuraishia capsulata CBS 1993 TaxID=1382522 RepID=W6MNK0_9ASCO|nr:uncharacterized protein KUCA_T00004226001 [Kuraishia capsulata CBS 1993]CDK28244.1 unnamed protein product [Kuraishia capsulata CBS 1993]